MVQAQYWHDPLEQEKYVAKSVFLADINNERKVKNVTYKENLQKLENFVMVKFSEDTVVDPRGTEWFGFFKPGQGKEMEKLEVKYFSLISWVKTKTLNSVLDGFFRRVNYI